MRDASDLETFAINLHQEVLTAAEGVDEGALLPEEFTRWMFGALSDIGEIDDGEICYYQARGVEASGYSLDQDLATLDLFVARYTGSEPPATVSRADVQTGFRRLLEFYERARQGLFRSIEEASPAFDMAQTIHSVGSDLRSLRLFYLTDGLTTLENTPTVDHNGLSVSYHVWDLRRVHRAVSSGQVREPISIDFVALYGAPLSCVAAGAGDGEYTAYLCVVPGSVLADVYDRFGPRLLERNVRSFLQARGKVNKGIRATILNEPGNFLAFNNGIAITASRLRSVPFSDGGVGIAALEDLQIVNGGQTTASIYASRRDDADLSRLTVAAKITVVRPELLDEFVPKITRYANSQNRINEADFYANDPYHVAIERFSRTVWAPALDGTQRQTKWFYERARGQYQDELAREGTPSRQRAFKSVYPTSQKFTKTDLAKFENAWAALPYVVSLGAEKNFRDFAMRLGERGRIEVTSDYFQRVIAKAVLFRQTERIVSAQNFGGYRANIVAYTVAYLSHATQQRVNLELIWKSQRLDSGLEDAIAGISRVVRQVIISPPQGGNVTEWSKRKDCWDAVVNVEVPGVETLPGSTLIQVGAQRRIAETLEDYQDPAEQEQIARIEMIPANLWFELSHWAKETGNLQGWQRSIAFSLGRIAGAGGRPSRKQAAQAEKMLAEAARLGFRIADASGDSTTRT
jgi:hypothetical protein